MCTFPPETISTQIVSRAESCELFILKAMSKLISLHDLTLQLLYESSAFDGRVTQLAVLIFCYWLKLQ